MSDKSIIKHERETIIDLTDGAANAHVYTYNRGWISHMTRNFGPGEPNRWGGYSWVIPANAIRRPLPKRARSVK